MFGARLHLRFGGVFFPDTNRGPQEIADFSKLAAEVSLQEHLSKVV